MTRKFIVKELLIGFLITLLCNLAGIYFVSNFTDYEFFEFLKISSLNGSLSSVIALGALMDFLPFFVFLKKGQFMRLRGVLIGVLIAAFTVMYLKFK